MFGPTAPTTAQRAVRRFSEFRLVLGTFRGSSVWNSPDTHVRASRSLARPPDRTQTWCGRHRRETDSASGERDRVRFSALRSPRPGVEVWVTVARWYETARPRSGPLGFSPPIASPLRPPSSAGASLGLGCPKISSRIRGMGTPSGCPWPHATLPRTSSRRPSGVGWRRRLIAVSSPAGSSAKGSVLRFTERRFRLRGPGRPDCVRATAVAVTTVAPNRMGQALPIIGVACVLII